MELLDRRTAPPLRFAHPGIRAVPLRTGMWRVTRPDGTVLGYVEPVGSGADASYRSKRMFGRDPRFAVIGEFRTADAAVDALC